MAETWGGENPSFLTGCLKRGRKQVRRTKKGVSTERSTTVTHQGVNGGCPAEKGGMVTKRRRKTLKIDPRFLEFLWQAA